MGNTVTCRGCQRETNAIHYGGDANIPPPGVCDTCQQVAVGVVRARTQASIKARIESELAKGGSQ